MKTLAIACCVLALAVAAFGDQPSADETMSQLGRSAREELQKSSRDLNGLRQQIEAERTPLADELTKLEDKLSQLRRTHEDVARQVDSGLLEAARIKGEIKARQDELTYIGNLLDEYAKTFESKVHVCELQNCGEALDAAKGAAGNNALSTDEKLARQIAFVAVSTNRLVNAVGGARFPGTAVDMQSRVVNGKFAVIGPVALFRSDDGGASGLVIPQAGSSRPLVRPLEGELQAGIGQLVATGEGLLPLDPSRGAALKALVQKTSLIHIFKKGGPIMYPLLIASVLALGTVLERLVFLLGQRLRRDPKALDRFLTAVTEGNLDGAILASGKSKFFVVRALNYALRHKEQSLANALLYSQAQELKRFRRGIPVLDTVITLAPLLGLLGTVTGMMGSFSLIGGELSAPGAITGGIAEALIATAFGLGIAITSLIPFNFLNARTEEARHELESAATQLELLVKPTPGKGQGGNGANNGGGPAGPREQHHPKAEVADNLLESRLGSAV